VADWTAEGRIKLLVTASRRTQAFVGSRLIVWSVCAVSRGASCCRRCSVVAGALRRRPVLLGRQFTSTSSCPLCRRARHSICQQMHESASHDDDDDSRLCCGCGAVLFDAIFMRLSSRLSSSNSRRTTGDVYISKSFSGNVQPTDLTGSHSRHRVYWGDGSRLRNQLAPVVVCTETRRDN